jgi:hypothetical protein
MNDSPRLLSQPQTSLPLREDMDATARIRSSVVIRTDRPEPPALAKARSWTLKPFAWSKLGLPEAVVVGLLLLAGIALQVGLSGSTYLLQRHFWLDEIYTHTLVSDPDLGHALKALSGGVETHPPTLYALLRVFTTLSGGCNEIALRSFALLSVIGALLGLYVVLRTAYAPLVALTPVLAIWGHGLVVHHAFEARFYGPMLAGAIWFAYFLNRSRAPGARRPILVLLAVSSLFLCTIHYFGIISFGLVAAFELLFHRPVDRTPKAAWLAASLGPLALAACLPLLVSQRAAFTVPTWVRSPTLSTIAELGTWILLPASFAAVLLAAWLSTLLQKLVPPKGHPPATGEEVTAMAGLTGLVFMPAFLILFSFAVQPVWVERYALSAVAGLAPAVAFLVARIVRVGVLGLIVFFLVVSTQQLRNQTVEAREQDQRTDALIATLRQPDGGGPIICEHLSAQYVLHHYAPDLAPFFVDHEPGQTDCRQNEYFFSRDLCRNYQAHYTVPKTIPWEALPNMSPRYRLIAGVPWSRSKVTFLRHYPAFEMHELEHGLYQLVAAEPVSED